MMDMNFKIEVSTIWFLDDGDKINFGIKWYGDDRWGVQGTWQENTPEGRAKSMSDAFAEMQKRLLDVDKRPKG